MDALHNVLNILKVFFFIRHQEKTISCKIIICNMSNIMNLTYLLSVKYTKNPFQKCETSVIFGFDKLSFALKLYIGSTIFTIQQTFVLYTYTIVSVSFNIFCKYSHFVFFMRLPAAQWLLSYYHPKYSTLI